MFSSTFPLRLALFGLVAFALLGCQPAIMGAAQVGSHEPATWVYIKSEDRHENAIYRCLDTPQGPICKKAKMAD